MEYYLPFSQSRLKNKKKTLDRSAPLKDRKLYRHFATALLQVIQLLSYQMQNRNCRSNKRGDYNNNNNRQPQRKELPTTIQDDAVQGNSMQCNTMQSKPFAPQIVKCVVHFTTRQITSRTKVSRYTYKIPTNNSNKNKIIPSSSIILFASNNT